MPVLLMLQGGIADGATIDMTELDSPPISVDYRTQSVEAVYHLSQARFDGRPSIYTPGRLVDRIVVASNGVRTEEEPDLFDEAFAETIAPKPRRARKPAAAKAVKAPAKRAARKAAPAVE